MARRTRLLSRLEHLEDRLTPAGALDFAFDTDGKVTVNFGDTDTARAVAVMPDGRIVTAGSWNGGFSDFAIARFKSDGAPDPTFGVSAPPGVSSGKQNVFFGNTISSGSEIATALAVQPDGKIVVAGYTNLNGGGASIVNDFAIARLNTDGSLDTSFGEAGTGKVTVDFPTGNPALNSDDRANGVALQGDKIVVVGSREFGGLSTFAFVRLDKNGKLDDTFSQDGKATVAFGSGDFATAVAVQGDKIVAAGYTDAGGAGANPNNFLVVRLLDDGTPDPNFDGDGIQTVDFGNDDRATAVAIQPDLAIVVVGSRDAGGGGSDFAVARLTTEGFTDITFNGLGKQTINIGGNSGLILSTSDYATGVKVQPDGKIVVGGYSTLNVAGQVPNFAAARLTKIGGYDDTFGTGGVQTVDFGFDDRAYALDLQTDGRIVLAGGNSKDFALARLKGEEADLSVTVTNNVTSVTAGSTVTYTIVVRNDGPDEVVYEQFGSTIPPALGNVSYSSTTTGGASATPGTGSGPILDRLRLPSGGVVTYTLNGTVSPTATGTLALASAVVPQGWFDANAANNVSGDTDPITPAVSAFQFSAPTYTVGENGGQVTITVNRVGSSTGDVSVRVVIAPGTATLGSDYNAASGKFNWADGDATPRTFNVAILDDALAEGSETVDLLLSDPTPGAALFAPFTAVLTITDDDAPSAGAVVFSAPTYTAGENGGPVTITVNRVGGSTGEVSVRVNVVPGTASLGSDYNAASGTFRWADGDTSAKTFNIAILDDALAEGNETINLSLTAPTGGAALGSTKSAVVTITDNDTLTILQPQPAQVGGRMDGSAVLLEPVDGKYFPRPSAVLIPGSTNVRVATADVNGDGVPDRIAGAGAGGTPTVVVVDGKTGANLASFLAFEGSFTGGVYVAAADLDGDGKADVVVTPDEGGGPVVALYSGAKLAAGLNGDAAQMIRYFGIDDPSFRGGARPTLGDISGDKTPELIVAAGFLGGPRITIWDGKSVLGGNPRPLANFFAFEETLRNGAFVAAGDVDGDGIVDVAFGGGPGGAPRVRVVSGPVLAGVGSQGRSSLDRPPGMTSEEFAQQLRLGNPFVIPVPELANFFAGDPDLRGGVRLALRDFDGNGKADLITGSGEAEPSRVRAYKSATLLANVIPTPTSDQEIDPFGGAVLTNGVFVG